MPAKLILSVSHDPILLSTREQVLRSAGHPVESTLSIEAAIAILESYPVDLVLIGHTVPVLERKQLISLIRNKGITIPVILVKSLGMRDNEDAIDVNIVVSSRPEDLIREIYTLSGDAEIEPESVSSPADIQSMD